MQASFAEDKTLCQAGRISVDMYTVSLSNKKSQSDSKFGTIDVHGLNENGQVYLLLVMRGFATAAGASSNVSPCARCHRGMGRFSRCLSSEPATRCVVQP